jgi:predicted amino acid-binding ACT domain protein
VTPASSRAGSARPAATAGECSTRPTRTPARSIVCACTSPDRPGVLAGIFQALGAERINVSDFELEHLSPERGGTLTVLVTGEDDAAQAVSLLESQGYGVVLAPVLDA